MTRTPLRTVPGNTEWLGWVTGVALPETGRTRTRRVGVERALRHFRAGVPDLVWNMVALEGGAMTPEEVTTLLGGVTVGGHLLAAERRVLELGERCTGLADAVERRELLAPDGASAVDTALTHLVATLSAAPVTVGPVPFLSPGTLAEAQLGLAADLLPAGWRVPLLPRSRAVEIRHALAVLAEGDAGEIVGLLRDCAVL